MIKQDLTLNSRIAEDSVSARFQDALILLQSSRTSGLLTHRVNFSKESVWSLILMLCMVAIITAVSIYDVYWSFKTAAILHETEQNPIGSWLISLDGGDISLFMTAKMVGTMLVILAIPAIYYLNKCWGLVCASALTLFQLLLVVYFEIGHVVFP